MSLPFMFKICIYHWIWIEFFICSLQYSIVQSVFSMVAFLFSRGSSQPRDWTQSPTLQVDSLPAEPQGKPRNTGVGSLSLLQGIFPTQDQTRVPVLQEDSLPTELWGKPSQSVRLGLMSTDSFDFSFIWGCFYFLLFLKDISAMLSS